jgi:hypothetical protein
MRFVICSVDEILSVISHGQYFTGVNFRRNELDLQFKQEICQISQAADDKTCKGSTS